MTLSLPHHRLVSRVLPPTPPTTRTVHRRESAKHTQARVQWNGESRCASARAVAVGAWCWRAWRGTRTCGRGKREGEKKKGEGTVGGLRVEGWRRRRWCGEESKSIAAEGTHRWQRGGGEEGTSYVFRGACTHSCVGGHTRVAHRERHTRGRREDEKKRRRRERWLSSGPLVADCPLLRAVLRHPHRCPSLSILAASSCRPFPFSLRVSLSPVAARFF